MEIEVVGRHALLFDDDAMAAFVNSSDALVDWNSIPIDRYDVRHLLSSPPPPRRRHHHHHVVDSFESDLDQERYLDLSLHQQQDDEMKPVDTGGYNAVGFSYGNNEESAVPKTFDSGLGSSSFCPPFPVPVDLAIPPTEKLHHIIARTAIYVSKHGAQSEIVLRVKQGDNPTFGFLMPGHHLHSYFRFLVDHSEVLHSDAGEKPQIDKISNTEPGVGGGALSLLGSLYGFGEDEDGAVEHAVTSEEKASDGAITDHISEKTVSPKSFSNYAVLNRSVNSQDKVPAKPKDKIFVLKRNTLTSGLKAGGGSGTRKVGESSGLHSATTDKLRSSSVAPTSMIEPPSEMKKMIAKIVEFILKNGKQFEAVLIEQDSEHGRFPFLLPSSQYYQYYLQVLQEAQKSKVSGRASLNENDGLGLHGSSKKTIVSKGSGSSTLESAECDIPFDSERKEKFKMFIGKSKNDGLDPPEKASQQQSEVGVDAAAAAVILQAATRGIRKPNLDFLSRSSLNRKDDSSEHVSSLGSLPLSQPQSVSEKSGQNGSRCSVPVVKENAKTSAIGAAGESGSLEAQLTREQKLKAERLRRAKMFVAMIKSGSATQIKPESSRGTSLEPSHAGADTENNHPVAAKERAGSPLEIDATESIESSANKFSTDEYNERKARRKYRSNSGKHEAAKVDTGDEEDEVVHKHSRKKHRKEEKGVDDRDIKHPRKRHTSHASEDYVSEQEDHLEKYYRYSRKHRRSRRSSHDRDEKDEIEHEDERDHKYSRKHHRSSSDEYEDERKHDKSRRSSHDGDEKDEVEHDDERDHRYSRKHNRSYKSSNDEEEEEHEDRRSRKKHRSHQSSHRSRHHSSRDSHGHKHRKRHHTPSKDKESRRRDRHNINPEEENVHSIGYDGLNGKVPRSEREDLEEGEISAKVSDQSRGSAGGREPSVDVSSSFQDQRSSSQPLEPTEVPNDLRAKIRAMLLETL
ncbi:uncharacterized protein LOC141685313 isoform X2 [Apium graveolens]|uniref:uncharacterized protein LOC141685313 isoform X2 n=1 Tax=Apium graveolens TaxID=4045 RepID=UPI003D7953C8